MKPKVKSILALTGTLIIGLVIGSLITFQFIRSRIKDFRELRQPKYFKEHLLKAAHPSPEQEAQIAPLIERFGEQMESLREEHKVEATANFNLLRDSLDIYLDDEQMERVDRKLERMQGHYKKDPHEHGPHGPDKRRGKSGRDRHR